MVLERQHLARLIAEWMANTLVLVLWRYLKYLRCKTRFLCSGTAWRSWLVHPSHFLLLPDLTFIHHRWNVWTHQLDVHQEWSMSEKVPQYWTQLSNTELTFSMLFIYFLLHTLCELWDKHKNFQPHPMWMVWVTFWCFANCAKHDRMMWDHQDISLSVLLFEHAKYVTFQPRFSQHQHTTTGTSLTFIFRSNASVPLFEFLTSRYNILEIWP